MKEVGLVIALHHHQPVGNLRGVLEESYERCYLPLLQTIENFPELKFNLSYSGPLLEFFKSNHPDFLDRLRNLLDREQIEILSDGFYEPVLAEIPRDARRLQLELMQTWLKDNLNVTPRGVWLAEAVWSPVLSETFNDMNLDFTALRSERFLQAGMRESQLHGHYVTEAAGKVTRVLPVDPNLRRMIPYGDLQDLMRYLGRQARRSEVSTLTFADVAERWGVWPGSHDQVMATDYPHDLFQTLQEASGWLTTRLASESIDSARSQGRVYLPGGANWDLGAWSLPAESREEFFELRLGMSKRHDANRILPYFRAGSWSAFLARYFQANLMSKKGYWLRGMFPSADAMWDKLECLLLEAQCNTAYWHGAAGGILLPHLRYAIWDRLLQVEEYIRRNQDGYVIQSADVDADGEEEKVVSSREFSYGIKPDYGGSLYELSHLQRHFNILSTLPREQGGAPTAHQEAPKAEPAKGRVHDWAERFSFLDHFFDRHVTTDQLQSNTYKEFGDFVNQPYEVAQSEVCEKGGFLKLQRDGKTRHGLNHQDVRVVKTYKWTDDVGKLVVSYELENTGKLPLDVCFASEVNLSLPGERKEADEVEVNGKSKEFLDSWFEGKGGCVTVTSVSAGIQINICPQDEGMIWSFPILTSVSEEMSPMRQGNAFFFGSMHHMQAGAKASFDITLWIA